VDGGSDSDVETYLRFRVAGAPGSLQSAKLRLYATTGTVNGPAVYSTGSSWSETAIAWTSRPSRTSVATDDKGSISTGAWVEYDVKSLLSGDGSYGFVLATNSTDGVDFPSREASDSTRRPRLILTYSSG
jgi:phosphoserine aminotransferase